MKIKIEIDQNLCLGCGACSTLSDNIEIVDGKAKPKKEEIDDEQGVSQDAADCCPNQAIKIINLEK